MWVLRKILPWSENNNNQKLLSSTDGEHEAPGDCLGLLLFHQHELKHIWDRIVVISPSSPATFFNHNLPTSNIATAQTRLYTTLPIPDDLASPHTTAFTPDKSNLYQEHGREIHNGLVRLVRIPSLTYADDSSDMLVRLNDGAGHANPSFPTE